MGEAAALTRGRRAFSEQRWGEAFAQLTLADAESPLEPADLESLAVAAYLLGREPDAAASWRRAHQAFLDRDDRGRAVRCGFWLSFQFLLGGDAAQSAGWLARLQRLLAESEPCAELGYVAFLTGLMSMGKDAAGACTRFEQAIALGERFGDRDLFALGLTGRGEALILLRRTSEGVGQLDEGMVTIVNQEVSPVLAGIVYCAVILTCQRILDLERCREWTRALSRWCDAQPDLVPFRGQCLVHRSEILQLDGEWPAAIEQATLALQLNAARGGGAAERAFYQRAELHRLCGELELAEQMYLEAGRSGVEPQPGLALLRLARGDVGAAQAAIRRAVLEGRAHGPGAGGSRVKVLAACVEIMVTAGDLDAAQAAATELASIAAETDSPFLRAISTQATGAVALAEGDPAGALTLLREAWTAWQRLEAPYESAQVRVLIGRACQALGDDDTARSHLDAAMQVFDRLGARPALAQLQHRHRREPPDPVRAGQLTARELEVLALVAAGSSNREIAGELGISEHTVARHLSNIFNKLDVTSRTAAVTFALENKLI